MEIEIAFTRRTACLTAVALALTVGCRHNKEKGLSSMVSMADPTTATQLVSGFHAVENGAWRWTMRKFSIVLKPPLGSDQKGATLRFKMFVPDDHVARLGPVTLSAEIDGHPLDPMVINKGGEVLYSQAVSPELLKAPSVKVNFSLDKSREPDNVDTRQLGVVAILIGLQAR